MRTFFSLILLLYVASVMAQGTGTKSPAAKKESEKKSTATEPTPVATFMGRSGISTLHQAELSYAHALGVSMNGAYLAPQAFYYDLLVEANGGKQILSASGMNLSEKMKNSLKDVKAGATITFQNIRCRMPDGTLKMLEPIQFKILE